MSAVLVAAPLLVQTAQAQQAGDGPVKIYLMAGQSNMVGWGNWYEKDAVTQHATLVDPIDPYPLTQAEVDAYTPALDQVWVAHPESNGAPGALIPGYGGRSSHIGIELSMGHELAATNSNQFYFFKSDKGGTTLGGDWRPPSAVADRGGDVGTQYTRAIQQFHETLVDFDTMYPEYNGAGYEIAGFVWLQGWSEYGNDDFRAEYQANLVDMVDDVRRDLGVADLPVIISDSPRNVTSPAHEQIAAAKAAAVADINAAQPGSAVYVNSLGIDPETGVDFFHWNQAASNYIEMGKRNAAGAQSVMRSTAVNHEGDVNVAAAWNGFRDTNSRIMRYEMEEAVGTTIYNTAGGGMIADAVLTSAAARTTTGLGPGSTGSIDTNDGVIRGTNDFGDLNWNYTLGAWVQLDELPDEQGRYVIMSSEDGDASGIDSGWNFGVERKQVGGEWENVLFFDLRFRNDVTSVNDSTGDPDIVLDAGQEYFVAFARDLSLGHRSDANTMFYLYDPLTETLISNDGGTSEDLRLTTFKNIRVGVGIDPDDYNVEDTDTLFQGLIDDAQIWNLTLGENDLLALIQQGSLSTPVPEPNSLALLGLGGLLALRRRRCQCVFPSGLAS